MDIDRLYLDYNATSPLSQSVINWLKSGDVLFANASSQHSFGKASRKTINETTSQLFSTFSLNQKNCNLFFHSGATEAFSSVAFSFSEWARKSGRNLIVCYSKLDHPAVTSLASRFWGEHTSFMELLLDENLNYHHDENLKRINEEKRKNPQAIILYHHLWVHNETGIVAPLEDLAPFKLISDLYIHVDAVQAPGKILDWKKLSVGDIFSFSAHKFGSLKGVGFSFYTRYLTLDPMITGGGQQVARSGTENVMGIQSISYALRDLELIDFPKMYKMKSELEKFIQTELAGIGSIISHLGRHRNSNTIYFYLNDLTSDLALALFDLSGLMISAGSACSSGTAKASGVLLHLGLDRVARNGLRISFGPHLNEDEFALIKVRFQQVIQRLKSR